MTPAAARFVRDALVLRIQSDRQRGIRPDPIVKAEVSELLMRLTWDDPEGLEATFSASSSTGAHDGHVHGSSPVVAVSLDEVADLMRVSTRHVQRLTASGGLPSFKSGRRRLVLRSDLDAYMGVTA